MRLNFICLIILLCIVIKGTGQEKGDFQWLFGKNSQGTNPFIGPSVMDFNEDLPIFYKEDREMPMDVTNGSICDKQGIILFYTNGVYIANANHEPMENGEDLNPGGILGFLGGLAIPQAALALPYPKKENNYLLLHTGLKLVDIPNGGVDLGSGPLYYSSIDMTLDNGLGAVTEKNNIIVNDTIDAGKITSVRHANGQDWWITVPKYDSKIIYVVLLNENGIKLNHTYEADSVLLHGLGQAVFSPDGNYYAHLSLYDWHENYLTIFEFDRCTGDFNQLEQIFYDDYDASGGVAVSPNSRYLYLSSYLEIYQFDLYASDISGSKETVAIYDGYEEPIPGFDSLALPTRFFLAQLAPDHKIYINTTNSVRSLHVINQPDMSGESCEVAQHSVQLATLNSFSMPNFPNYRLGALEGSPCDTLTSTNDFTELNFEPVVFPNPAQFFVKIITDKPVKSDTHFLLFNELGQTILETPLNSGQREFEIDLSNVPKGIYFYKIQNKQKSLGEGKLVVLKS